MKQSGVSLIELLIALSIISVLGFVAIPQYQEYKKKARQGEAKISLSTLYTMEKVFITNYGYGTPNFSQIGFNPKGIYWYNTGWNGNDRHRGRNNINKSKSDIESMNLTPEFRGPSERECPGKDIWKCNSVNIRGACDHLNKPVDDKDKPCFLKTPSDGRIVALRTVDKSQIGEGTSGTREVIVDNISYRNVDFLIGAINMYDDKWVMTDKKRLVNIP